MQNLTIITGKQGSGKTTLAMKMTGSKNTIWANRLTDNLLKNYLNEKTEVIILDEVVDVSGTVKTLQTLIKKGFVSLPTPQKNLSITRELPEIILISQCEKENFPAFILEHSKIISL